MPVHGVVIQLGFEHKVAMYQIANNQGWNSPSSNYYLVFISGGFWDFVDGDANCASNPAITSNYFTC